jgi:hypothetical protein
MSGGQFAVLLVLLAAVLGAVGFIAVRLGTLTARLHRLATPPPTRLCAACGQNAEDAYLGDPIVVDDVLVLGSQIGSSGSIKVRFYVCQRCAAPQLVPAPLVPAMEEVNADAAHHPGNE